MSLLSLMLIVASTTAVCVALMLLVRRSDSYHLVVDIDRGVGVLAFVGTAFSVLLAFIVFIAFDSYNGAKGSAESEANDIVGVSRNLDLFGANYRADLQGRLICYGRAVVSSEWPAMRHLRRSRLVDEWERELRKGSRKLNTGAAAQQAAFQNVIGELDALAEARRTRLSEAHPVVPQPIWVVLVLGALSIVAMMLLIADSRESPIVQALLMASVAVMLSASLTLVWFLDHPYRNQTGSIKPTEMQRSIEIIQDEQSDVTPPCSPQGTMNSASRRLA